MRAQPVFEFKLLCPGHLAILAALVKKTFDASYTLRCLCLETAQLLGLSDAVEFLALNLFYQPVACREPNLRTQASRFLRCVHDHRFAGCTGDTPDDHYRHHAH